MVVYTFLFHMDNKIRELVWVLFPKKIEKFNRVWINNLHYSKLLKNFDSKLWFLKSKVLGIVVMMCKYLPVKKKKFPILPY